MMRLPLLQHLGRSRLSRGVGTTASIGSSNSTIHQMMMMMTSRGGMCRTGSSYFTTATRPAAAPPTEASPQRLFLWVPTAQIIAGSHHDALSLSGKENDPSHHRQQRSTLLQQHVLLPSAAIQQFVAAPQMTTTMQVVQSVDDIVAAVNQHYSIDHHHKDRDDDDDAPQPPPARTQFVGGMGEQDLGVYFISLPSGEDSSYQDLLHHTETIELLRDGIEHVKAIRHGVPFGLYTSGLLRDEDHDLSFLKELNLDVLEVSLFGWDSSGSGGHPAERYQQFLTSTVGRKDAQRDDLQHICQFITSAVESQQQNVHVSLLQPPKNHHHTWDTKEAAQLAMSLGAQEVHYYTKE